MSAFLSVCYPDRIELLTDGAVYTEDGILIGVREKVYRLTSVPAAITTRGDMVALDAIGEAIDKTCMLFSGFDAGIAMLPRLLKRLHEEGTAVEFEALIAGISEGDGPVNLYFTTASYIDGITPFTLHTMPPAFGGGPKIGPDELAAAGIRPEDMQAGLAERGADIMEVMRARPGPNPVHPDLPHLHGIGGHCDLTVIRRDGVTTTRLRTWGDRIGEKIDPSADGNIVAMSRQQRRAAARQAGKRRVA